jgi:hypothetical protein
MIVFPTMLQLGGLMFSERNVSYTLSISGGLSSVLYMYYWALPSGQVNPIISADFYFMSAAWMTPWNLAIWVCNLWLGIVTLRFVNGKTTIKRVRALAAAIIVIDLIPSLLIMLLFSFWGPGMFIVPLPFFPIAMVLMARFVHPPVPQSFPSEEMIRIPLRLRISSIFRRGKNVQQTERDIDNQISSEDIEDS